MCTTGKPNKFDGGVRKQASSHSGDAHAGHRRCRSPRCAGTPPFEDFVVVGVGADGLRCCGSGGVVCGGGWWGVLQLLLTRACVSHQDDVGKTALMLASINGLASTVQKLLEHGARPELADKVRATECVCIY